MILDQSVRLEAVLDTGSADVTVDYIDYLGLGPSESDPQPSRSELSGSAETTILAMPTGNVQFREVQEVTIFNTHSAAVVATVNYDDGSAEHNVYRGSLGAGQVLQYVKMRGWFKESV